MAAFIILPLCNQARSKGWKCSARDAVWFKRRSEEVYAQLSRLKVAGRVTKGNKFSARTAFNCTLVFSHQMPIKLACIGICRRFRHPKRWRP